MIKENRPTNKVGHEEHVENFNYIFYIILSCVILLNFVFVVMGIGDQYIENLTYIGIGVIIIVLYILVSKDSRRLKKKKKSSYNQGL